MKGKKGNQPRDDNLAQKYKVSGLCTTVMIRNIPNEYTQDELIAEVSQSMGATDTFDFFYLPWDSQNNSNVGYAFVNFLHSSTAQKAVRVFSSYKFKLPQSTKVAQVSPAHIQGLENNLRHLQDRAVVHSNLPCSPVVMWKGLKVELSAIFHEMRVQDMLKKFSVPQSVPCSSSQRFMQRRDTRWEPSAGNLMDTASADGARTGRGGPLAASYMGQRPSESTFPDLLGRAAERAGSMTFADNQSFGRFGSQACGLQGAVPGLEPQTAYAVPPGSAGSRALGVCGPCPGKCAGASHSSSSQRANAGFGAFGSQRQMFTGDANFGCFPAAGHLATGDGSNFGLEGYGNMEFGGGANMAFGSGCDNKKGGCGGGGSSRGADGGGHGGCSTVPNLYTGLDLQNTAFDAGDCRFTDHSTLPLRGMDVWEEPSRTTELWEDDGPSSHQQQPWQQPWQQPQQQPQQQPEQQQQQPWLQPPESEPAMTQTLEHRFGIPKLSRQAMSSRGTRADGHRKNGVLAPVPDPGILNSTWSSEADMFSAVPWQHPKDTEMQHTPERGAPGLVSQEGLSFGGAAPNTTSNGISTPSLSCSSSTIGWSSDAIEPLPPPPAHSPGHIAAIQGRAAAFSNWTVVGTDDEVGIPMQLPSGITNTMGGSLDASQPPPPPAHLPRHAGVAQDTGAFSHGNTVGDDNGGIRDIIVQNAQQDVLQKFLAKFGP